MAVELAALQEDVAEVVGAVHEEVGDLLRLLASVD